MKRRTFMLVAGEASGDLLAAELVQAIRSEVAGTPSAPADDLQPLDAGLAPRFLGAGGPSMAAAGVEIDLEMTAHSVIGLSDVIRNFLTFRRMFRRLLELAERNLPDVVVCVDFSGFNRRFAHAIRRRVRASRGVFANWAPRIVQYVSPQVWASREKRATGMADDYDLLLSIIPFEREWYAARAPNLKVEFVGNPLVDRYHVAGRVKRAEPGTPEIVLLPGSRLGELRRHLPIIAETARQMRTKRNVRFRLIVPTVSLKQVAESTLTSVEDVHIHVGGMQDALANADLAITKSGTIALECAFFGVPAIVFYVTSRITYAIGKRVVKVPYLAMPNLLAKEPVYPEFVQNAATPENLSRTALELLEDTTRCNHIRATLARIVKTLGEPGASRRAAQAILKLVDQGNNRTR